MTQHITFIEGGDALGRFRAQQILPRLQAIDSRIEGISARFVHVLATETLLSPEALEPWVKLLTYGDPYTGSGQGVQVVVSPRLGTVSPWASKATDIARNCGFVLKRVERVVHYFVQMKPGWLASSKL